MVFEIEYLINKKRIVLFKNMDNSILIDEEFILYSKSNKDKIKKWTIKIIKDINKTTIVSTFGNIDGKLKIFNREILNGKNIGKKNQTSHYEQALKEVSAKINKKKDEGYKENIEVFEIKNKKQDIIYPMLALDYKNRNHNIKFDCYVQPKIDGCRSIFYNKQLYSRKGKNYNSLLHIIEEIYNCPFILDGELYSDVLTFQELCGLIKKQKLSNKDKEKIIHIKYIVYDMVSEEIFDERYKKLKLYFNENSFKSINLLLTEICNSKEDVIEKKVEYVKNGYEGLIIRNKNGKYKQNYRSPDLQKYKDFIDSEYEIIGYKNSRGTEKGCVIWICKTEDGKQFNVRPSGIFDERRELYKNADEYIGNMLTVKYQGLTSDNIPRFPVGIIIRNYE